MAQVLIRNLEDDVLTRLKRMAEAAHLPLEAYLRRELEDLARPSRDEIMKAIDAIAAKTRPWKPGDPTSVDYIREGREEAESSRDPESSIP